MNTSSFIRIICSIATILSVLQGSPVKASELDTAEIMKNLKLSQYYSSQKQNKDSAVFYMDKAFELIPTGKKELPYDMLIKVASYLQKESNYTGALEYYQQALQILDEEEMRQMPDSGRTRKYVQLYQDIAFSQHLYNPEQAVTYLKKSLRMAEKAYAADKSFDIGNAKMQAYNNIGAVYTDIGRFDSAEFYYQKAFEFRKPDDPQVMGKLYNNLGIISAQKNDLTTAMDYFNKTLKLCATEQTDTNTLCNAYLNLGHCAILTQDYQQAIGFLQRSASLSKQTPYLRNELYSHESLAKAYEKTGSHAKSLEHLKKAYALKDSLMSIEHTRASISTELSYQYQKLQSELQFRQEMENKKKDYRTLFFMLSATILLFLVILLSLLYRIQRNKAHSIQLEQESLALHTENLELKNKRLKDELESKQKELNTHAQYLLERNDFVSSVIEQINMSKEKNSAELNKTLQQIRSNLQDSVSNELQALFQDLHNEFFTHLYEKHPDLSPNEKRLCSFIHLHMSSKDISSVTGQSVKAIEIARSRLRAKLGLKREDNLNAYLQQF